MELRPMRRTSGPRILALFAALMTACCLLLTSCGSLTGGEAAADRRSVLSFLETDRLKTGRGEGGLYDLTSIADQQEGAICAYGLCDETHLVLLREQDRTGSGSAGSRSYKVDLLDLRDGSGQEIASFDSIPPAEDIEGDEGTALPPDPEIISADPLILHDRAGAVIYRPGMDPSAIVLPKWLRDAHPVCLSGRLYLASSRGILFEILQDGALHKVFKIRVLCQQLMGFQ